MPSVQSTLRPDNRNLLLLTLIALLLLLELRLLPRRGADRHRLLSCLAEEPFWSYPNPRLWYRKPHIHREGRVDVAIKTPAVTALLRLLSEPEALAGSSETQKAFLDGLGAREVPLPSMYQILSSPREADGD